MIAALAFLTASHQLPGAERVLGKSAAGAAVGAVFGAVWGVIWLVRRCAPESSKTNDQPKGPPPLPRRGPPRSRQSGQALEGVKLTPKVELQE